jgi:hypothetical protein
VNNIALLMGKRLIRLEFTQSGREIPQNVYPQVANQIDSRVEKMSDFEEKAVEYFNIHWQYAKPY